MRPGNRTPAAVERVAENLRGYSFVEDVRFGREWLDKLVSLRKVFAGTAVVIGGAFAAVAAIIIASAVRIAVFARREEISIMRLVGATNGFIQRPFLLEGLFAGTLGGCLAVLLTFATFQYVNRALYQIAWLPPEWTLGGLLVGAGFGLVASAVAVRRHLGAV
jgi:cell division transport system permease protein